MFDITGFRIRRKAFFKVVWSYFPCHYVNKAGNQTNSKQEKRSVHEKNIFGITKFVIYRVYFFNFEHTICENKGVRNFKHQTRQPLSGV